MFSQQSLTLNKIINAGVRKPSGVTTICLTQCNTSPSVNGNVLESDVEPLCDGTTRRRSLADLRLLEGM